MTMTPRRIRSCRNCGRLALHRLCSRCHDEIRTASIARGTPARPTVPLLPTVVIHNPQPTKDETP